jgi:long-chain acyl-CoA synthetase
LSGGGQYDQPCYSFLSASVLSLCLFALALSLAAISRSTQEYLTTTIVTVLQGLGATETVAMCTVLPPDFFSFGPAGVPVPSMEIKVRFPFPRGLLHPPLCSSVLLADHSTESNHFDPLEHPSQLVDVKDAGYTSNSNPPRGEICCRGASLFTGYFKRPDLDAEAFTEDGWFKSESRLPCFQIMLRALY